ncbi:TRAP transporter small permease [Alphaproteobacteria bacterium KMM 3653]|uniref:TRAP transporter small permease protein n=1 Tax=Harenicola maris TaxID=2841044 RepID=A0AAP2CMQ0_9RHOB|nr:TRAP transporter small permease [Harenicola maris]
MKFSILIQTSRLIHVLSSLWILILALVILVDVFGRILFLSPLPGTKEILQSSVIAVAFLQIPLAVFSNSMLRTTLLTDALPATAQRVLRSAGALLGLLLFGAIAYAAYPEAVEAFQIGEYEGEGSLRIYTWPVRFLIVVTAAFSAVAYVVMMIADWRGDLDDANALTTH